jgi:zinc transporter ZupT
MRAVKAETRSGAWVPPRVWLAALVPVALLGVLIALILKTMPADLLRGDGAPPVERLVVQRAVLGPEGITLSVLNDGPDPITIAQVMVDDAYWRFTAENGAVLDHLGSTSLVIPYPWVIGETHVVKVVTSTGMTFEHEIPVAVRTPRPDGRALLTFTLIGIYVGVIPVALGLLWFPVVARLGRTGLDVLLAVTIGLLLFLLIDAAREGLEKAAEMPASFQGIALFLAGATAAYLALESIGAWLRARRTEASGAAASGGAVLALLVAIGIGLHNLGEGLAIGAAFALGEAALGTLLIIGFTLHNTVASFIHRWRLSCSSALVPVRLHR